MNRESDRIPRSLLGVARVSEHGELPYGRRLPVPTSRDCRDLEADAVKKRLDVNHDISQYSKW